MYDRFGKRVNTKEMRAKDKMLDERDRLVKEVMTLNPMYRVGPLSLGVWM